MLSLSQDLRKNPLKLSFLRDLCVLCGSLRQAAPRLRFSLAVGKSYK